MAHQYFKDVDPPSPKYHGQDFTFTAVGNPVKDTPSDTPRDMPRAAGYEKDEYHPYATLSGSFHPARYKPNFDNGTSLDLPNSTRASGLSEHALNKARGQYTGHETPDDVSHREIRHDLMARYRDEMDNDFGSPEHLEYQAKANSGFYDKLEKDAVKRASTHPYFQQDTLFDTTPSTIHVNTMFSDPSMTKSAITLGALAKQHFGPAKIEASHDLSPFSSKLVKNAASRGLVETSEGNPTARVTNDSTLSPMQMPSTLINQIQTSRIPDTEVQSAKADLRESLRGRKNQVVRNATPSTSKGLGNQFLPGMEGFV